MKKFFGSKLFVILMPIITLVIGGVAGWLLGYQPMVKGSVSGWSGEYGGSTSGKTSTEYLFQLKTASGYWLFAIILSLVVFLLCVIIRKQYINQNTAKSDSEF